MLCANLYIYIKKIKLVLNQEISMKKYLLLLPFLIFLSCQDFPTVSFDLSNEMNFDINKPGTQYDGTKLLDPTTNAQFDKYSKKLNDITVTRVTYTISNFEGTTAQTASASFDAADGDGKGKVNIGSFSNVNLSALNGKETDLTVPSAAIATLAGFMKASPYKVTVYYTGSVNQSPVKFNLKLKFYTKVKARVIGSN